MTSKVRLLGQCWLVAQNIIILLIITTKIRAKYGDCLPSEVRRRGLGVGRGLARARLTATVWKTGGQEAALLHQRQRRPGDMILSLCLE
jgi:hypothetical protein